MYRKHGQGGNTRTPEYEAWAHMLRRCHTPTTKNYADYGGRGITVCDRWRKSFANFFEDMGTRPSKHHSLERKDNEKGYSPDNCKWATRVEQNNNARFTRRITRNGKTQGVRAWERDLGLPRGRISYRLNHGWSIEKAFTL